MGAAALPYVDTEIERPGMRERVRRMIEEEMQTFRPTRDYVAHIRVPELALEVCARAWRAARCHRNASTPHIVRAAHASRPGRRAGDAAATV